VKSRTYSAKLYTTYLSKFPDTIKGKIYLMNVPSYCSNAYLFRAKYRFPISYQAIYHKDLFNQVVQVAWYNSITDQDSFAVKKITDSSFEMQLKTNGAWWMNESNGASDYENDDYKFDIGEWGNYTLTFKHPFGEEDALLYFNGKRFVKVN
jgi:membrane carboxypeptidase/penicillin-binding protein PbpC